MINPSGVSCLKIELLGSYLSNGNPLAKRRSDTEPGTHRIIGKQGAFYKIIDEHGNIEHKTRVKLSY